MATPQTQYFTVQDIGAAIPELFKFVLASTSTGTAAVLTGFYLDSFGTQITPLQTYSIASSGTTFVTLAGGSIPVNTVGSLNAVAFVGKLTSNIYVGFGGTVSGGIVYLPGTGYPLISSGTAISFGRVNTNAIGLLV